MGRGNYCYYCYVVHVSVAGSSWSLQAFQHAHSQSFDTSHRLQRREYAAGYSARVVSRTAGLQDCNVQAELCRRHYQEDIGIAD
jgi:hypothetical protein